MSPGAGGPSPSLRAVLPTLNDGDDERAVRHVKQNPSRNVGSTEVKWSRLCGVTP